MHGRDGAGDAIGSDFGGITVPNLETRPGAGLENERINGEVLPAAAPQGIEHLRHDGADRNLVDA